MPDSNYLPALEKAEMLLKDGLHDSCALSLFFLSDGAPTDAQGSGLTPHAAERKICSCMEGIATTYGDQLSVLTVGFGSWHGDFSVLKEMADAAKNSTGVASADFVFCDKMPNAIGDAVSSLVSTTTETRTSLMHGKGVSYTKRNVAAEERGGNVGDWKFYEILDHFEFDPETNGFVYSSGLPPGAWRKENQSEFDFRRKSPPHTLLRARNIAVPVVLNDLLSVVSCHNQEPLRTSCWGQWLPRKPIASSLLRRTKTFTRGFWKRRA